MQNRHIHIQPPHFSVYTVTTRDLFCSCVNKSAKPAHPHPTASLFCPYCHNTHLVGFLCEQVCKTCPSTSNRLTFLSILSQPAPCSVCVSTRLQNLPIHIQPPHFSVSTVVRVIRAIAQLCLSLVCSNRLQFRINSYTSRQAVDKHTASISPLNSLLVLL